MLLLTQSAFDFGKVTNYILMLELRESVCMRLMLKITDRQHFNDSTHRESASDVGDVAIEGGLGLNLAAGLLVLQQKSLSIAAMIHFLHHIHLYTCLHVHVQCVSMYVGVLGICQAHGSASAFRKHLHVERATQIRIA
jgi:hypothetical protein